ncbi:biotin-dependent carboxyltransferase family protein [Gracilibacillus marinus]|uniref:Biotin-dependent carboxyltransferase family protein n=1 Tax=Gracilibacillus marinus TaxID=630535 RepID=A0ABV8VWE7_9BACI
MKIIEKGLATTIQDLGRFSYRSLGFPTSGPMDSFAMKIANFLVGNHENAAVLEMCQIGVTVEFLHDTVIACTGAPMDIYLNNQKIELYRPIQVKKGDSLRCLSCKAGMYTYLACKYGIAYPTILKSRSSLPRIKDVRNTITENCELPIQAYTHKGMFNWKIDKKLFDYMTSKYITIRYIEGIQSDWFASSLENHTWKITSQSNRMGYRLNGPPIRLKNEKQLFSEPVQFGAIQVPPNGQPIVIMADGQPTGGYPKIGQVIQADLAKLAQATIFTSITFQKVSIEYALETWKHTHHDLLQLKYVLLEKWREF